MVMSPASAALAEATKTATSTITVTVTGLRSDKGVIRACLTSSADKFPKCNDAHSVTLVEPAAATVTMTFTNVAPGRYAIALLHDENNNNKADRALLMMPKEGFGFSRDAKVRFGPPKFKAAAFDVTSGAVHQTIKMRYMF